MLRLTTLLLTFNLISFSFAADIPSPEAFLGYAPGTRFTFHYQITEYFRTVAAASEKVAIVPYGYTWEGRPLLVAVVTSPANHARLPQIKAASVARTGMGKKPEGKSPEIPIVWMSYNIHGDEASGSESAMAMLYHLVSSDTLPWLDSLVIVIDPCLNPDGRERYVQWQYQSGSFILNLSSQAAEHQEEWPGGRENHYLFDLNRDWCWQVQPESRQRAALFYEWMPQVHVDFHEMKNRKATYFFPPAAKPFHPVITTWQQEFHTIIGKNHGSWFDKNYWRYFSGENYDMFYPSYGDTWPSFQGAMGFTYEQTGGDRAGRAVILPEGDTLTLKDRITKHLVTGISTIETAFRFREKLLEEFKQYFEQNAREPYGEYKTFILKPTLHPERVKQLLLLLDRNHITYGRIASGVTEVEGFSYQENRQTSFTITPEDIVISAYQPNSRLLQVLFEPDPLLEDSLTYDFTAWALPYAYCLEAYAVKTRIKPIPLHAASPDHEQPENSHPYAWAVEWHDFHHAAFLSAALQAGYTPTRAMAPFKIGGKQFDRGTLVFERGKHGHETDKNLAEIAAKTGVNLYPLNGGISEQGPYPGSDQFKTVRRVNAAIVRGPEIQVNSFGELWYYFEQELQYPVTVLDTRFMAKTDLSEFDLLVLPSGNYEAIQEKIQAFVAAGGHVIAIEQTVDLFAQKWQSWPSTALYQAVEKERQRYSRNFMAGGATAEQYDQLTRQAISNSAPGSIFKVKTDPSHPLAFGIGDRYFVLKQNPVAYPLLEDTGWNAGVFPVSQEVHGFIGSSVKPAIGGSMAWGAEDYESGKITYFPDSPVVRGFWYSGKLLLANAVFY
ncbi:MAG: M14 family metallopeptidase [Bacteroidia bacterium]